MAFSMDMADVKPSVMSWMIVGIMAVTFIVLMKFLTEKYYVPGLSEVFAAA
jgi:hypothetical protein